MDKKESSFLRAAKWMVRNPLSLRFLKYVFVFISISLLAYGSWAYWQNDRLPNSHESLPEQYEGKFEINEKARSDSDIKKYQEVFEMKYNYYKGTLVEFKSIQKWMLVILILSMLVLIFGVNKVPFLGFTIPDNLIYLVIYFGGVYLWVNFGLTFNTIIDDRLSMAAYLDVINLPNLDPGNLNNPKLVLLDNSLGDNWFGWYFGIFDKGENVNNFFQFLGLYLIYAVVLGLYKCNLIVSSIEFVKRKDISPILGIGMISFVILMMVISTASFILDEKVYATLWMGAIWLVTAVTAFYWDSKGKSIYDTHQRKENGQPSNSFTIGGVEVTVKKK